MKAQYTAASAMTSVNEEAAGISKSFSDSGAALQRAQDKIANMQARASATDELLQSGVLEDVGGGTDDIQRELDEASSNADVDKELAAMKAQIASAPATPEPRPAASRQARPGRSARPTAQPQTFYRERAGKRQLSCDWPPDQDALCPCPNRSRRSTCSVSRPNRASIGRAVSAGLDRVIAPARPSLKTRYPLTPMENFARWNRGDGLHLDPWVRTASASARPYPARQPTPW